MNPNSIGRYRIEAELGTGRYCKVFHAYDLVRRRSVALKLLLPELLHEVRAWHGFLAEAQRATDLIHPHIAWIWETGEEDGKYFLVERFIGGETLAAQLTHSGPLPADQAIKALEQIAQAIEFSQQRGWTHGGVNPRNILLSPDLGAVLSDYGLQNAIRKQLGEKPLQLIDACYLPPEVLRGGSITQSSDIYGLACCLVEALTGKDPFHGQSLDEILEKKTTAFVSPQLPLETVPLQASQVIERALNPEVPARFKDALNFIDTFERAVRHGLTDAAGRAQHEEQLRQQRENQEKERIQAEEAARLEALELARREIQERARREAEQVIELQATMPVEGRGVSQFTPPVARDRIAPHPNLRVLLVLLGLIIVIALALGATWLRNHNLQPGSLISSASPTSRIVSQVAPSNTALVQTPTSTFLPTHTPRPSPTHAPSVTSTLYPTHTPSLTITATSPPPSSTPERLDRDARFGDTD